MNSVGAKALSKLFYSFCYARLGLGFRNFGQNLVGFRLPLAVFSWARTRQLCRASKCNLKHIAEMTLTNVKEFLGSGVDPSTLPLHSGQKLNLGLPLRQKTRKCILQQI